MVVSLDKAVEQSVNGGLRNDPRRRRFTDHPHALDETDENSGGTQGIDTVGQFARRLRTGKCISHPSLHGLEKAPDATINFSIMASQFHGRGHQQASAPAIGTAVALNVAGKVGPQAIDRLSARGEFELHPYQGIGDVAIKRPQEGRVLVTESDIPIVAKLTSNHDQANHRRSPRHGAQA